MLQRYHFYKITNTINGKSYIGYTGQYHATTRWKQHLAAAKRRVSQVLYDAIRKYGSQNFIFSVLMSIELTPDDAIKQETALILEHKTLTTENGYNVRTVDGAYTSAVKQSRSERMKAYYAHGGVSPMKGKKHRLESIQLMSETTKAMITEEQREQCRQMSLEQWNNSKRRQKILDHIKNPSKETRQKMSLAKQGCTPWNKGGKHTPEAIENMRIAHIGHITTEEHKQNIAKAVSASWTEDRRKQLSQEKMGHVVTDDMRKKIGNATRKFTYLVILPTGEEQSVIHLKEFCDTHGMHEATARIAMKQNRPTITGYYFKKVVLTK